ncbi:hypothetical protein PTSG_02659 [Salpingoeca rosetta]|uniref:Uncharacterized protein n=1 Tax=Salpingoeca rosetta (strain ATCC 50818 / BSB-021) TaxID=946362 RepID=F2U2Y1_SALR5|nr:uncharacterized protein PTSG_02659 [Salpingoeca rosetta]EGD81975.1 hypothetical protein PTSG_02659 [Salpingoeca rosetta]|eukprot:XP_004996158.1 hypothetical protein PTSG_02659 [Salpingoeca rosetta]
MPPPLKWAGSTTSMEGRLMVAVHEVIELNLQPNETLGLRVSGGTDTVDEGEDPGLFVEEVLEGAGSRDGRIKVDDKIIEVNGTRLGERTHEEYMGVLTEAVGSLNVVLLVSRMREVGSVSWEEFFAGRYGHMTTQGRYASGSIAYVSEGFGVVELEQSASETFGLALAGAKSKEEARVAAGVYIAAIRAGGPAAAAAIDGTLSRGQQIVEINGWACARATVAEVELLLNRFARATIVVKENPEGFLPFSDESLNRYYAPLTVDGQEATTESLRQVSLPFDPTGNTKLGLRIIGVPPNTKFDAHGVFVNGCAPGTAAADRLNVGDQIIEINGCTLAGATHDVAANTLRASKGTAKLLVVHNAPGYEYMTRMVEEHERELDQDPDARRHIKDVLVPDVRIPEVQTVRDADAQENKVVVRVARPVGQPIGVTIHVREVAGRRIPLITNVSAGSVAADTGKLRVGQQVFALNTTALSENTPHRDIENVLADTSLDHIELTVSAEPVVDVSELLANLILTHTSTAISHQHVRLVRIPDNINGLGFAFVGPSEESGLAPFGAYVSRTTVGELNTGDQLLAVSSNNHGKFECLFDCSYKKAMSLLMRAKMARETYLVVCSNPEGYAFFSAMTTNSVDLEQVLPPPISPRAAVAAVRESVAAEHQRRQQQQQHQQQQQGEEKQDTEKGQERIDGESGEQRQGEGGHAQAESTEVQGEQGEGVAAATSDKSAEQPAGVESQPATAAVNATTDSATAAGPAHTANASMTAPPQRSSFFTVTEAPFHVRAHFAWVPQNETQLGFAERDVLRVEELLSGDFWVATHLGTGARGQIPSAAYYEEFFKATPLWQQKLHIAQTIDQTMRDADEATRKEARDDVLTVHSYTVVEWQQLEGAVRPLAVFGMEAHKVMVGAMHLLPDMAIATPLRCTSRPMRDGETNGQEYEFVSREEMERRLAAKELIEVGSFKGNLYGTTIEAVAAPARDGKLVLMQCHPPAIRRLQLLGDIHPIVAFVAPAPERLQTRADGSAIDEAAQAAAWEQVEHGHTFTHVLQEGPVPALAQQVAAIVSEEARAEGLWAAVPALLPRAPLSQAASPSKMSLGLTTAPATLGNTSMTATNAVDTSTAAAAAGATEEDESLAMYSQSTQLKCDFETVVVQRLGKHKYGFKLVADDETGVPTVAPGDDIVYVNGSFGAGARVLCVGGQNVIAESSSKLKDAVKKNTETLSVVLFPRHLNVRAVKLKKRNNTFGLKMSTPEGFPATIITGVPQENIVREGSCRRGDAIVAVNGAPMLRCSLEEVTSAFTQQKTARIAVADADDVMLTSSGTSRRVELRRFQTNYGLEIAMLDDLPVVLRITAATVAAASDLNVGDAIYKINGMTTRNASYDTIMSTVRTSATLDLVVDKCPRFARREVTVERSATAGYGMHVQTTFGYCPVVTRVVEGSPAATGNAILPGDEIVEINGTATQGKMHEEVVAMLSRATTAKLSLRHPTTPTAAPMAPAIVPAAATASEQQQPTKEEETNNDAQQQEETHQQPPKQQVEVQDASVKSFSNARKVVFRGASVSRLGLRFQRVEGDAFFKVAEVLDGGLAKESGAISPGDAVAEVNGIAFNTREGLARALSAAEDTVSIVVGTPRQEQAGARVVLDTHSERLGLKIVCVQDSFPIVSVVDADGAAAKEPALVPGVTILKVNGRDMHGATSEDLRAALAASSLIELVLGDRVSLPQPPQEQEQQQGEGSQGGGTNLHPIRIARITPVEGESLGIAIRTHEGTDLCPVVPAIIAGSLAEKEGTITAGDEIVTINGTPTSGLTHEGVVALLKQPRDVIEIGVRQSLQALEPFEAAQSNVVRLEKSGGAFGLNLITAERVPAVVVGIAPNSAAQHSNAFAVGDVIMKINGESTVDLTHDELVSIFRSSDMVELESAPREDGEVKAVEATRGPSGLGLVIKSDDRGNSFITKVAEGSPAADAGVPLFAKILAVNNSPVIGLSHDDVVAHLRATTVSLLLRCPAGPVTADMFDMRMDQPAVPPSASQQQAAAAQGEATQTAAAADKEEDSSTAAPPSYDDVGGGDEGDANTRVVTLTRGERGYGFRLITNEDHASPIVIEALPNTPATNVLRPGDAILSINGTSTANLTHEEVLALIQSAGSINLRVRHDGDVFFNLLQNSRQHELGTPVPGLSKGTQTTVLKRGGGGYGLRIETLEGLRHIIVEVIPGGAAADSKQVHVGQEILEINGQAARGVEHNGVVSMLASTDEAHVKLTLPPQLGDCTLVRLRRDDNGSLGLRLQMPQQESPLSYPIISHVGEHNAAHLQPGDFIIRVNGASVMGKPLEEFAPAFLSDPVVVDVYRPAPGTDATAASPEAPATTTAATAAAQDAATPAQEAGETPADSGAQSQLQSYTSEQTQAQASAATANTPATEQAPAQQQQQQSPQEEGDGQGARKTVILQRTSTGFGLQIASPNEEGPHYHQITLVLPTARVVSGTVEAGDIIEQINGEDVTARTHEQLVDILSGQSMLEMVVRKPSPEQAQLAEPVQAFQQLMTRTQQQPNGHAAGVGEQAEAQAGTTAETAPEQQPQQEQQQQQQQQQETGTEQGEDKGYQSQSAAGRATADTGANAVQQQQQQQQQHDADEEATADAGDVSEPTPQIVEDDATAPPAPPARRTVTVAKNERGLGMKFLGLGQGLGVIVTALMPDTPAHACPDLNIYDTICKINGTDVLDLEHDAVRDILVSGSSFELEVLPAPAAKVAILVRESKDDPLGVAVVDDDHHRVRVANVSEAARFADAQLEPGEEIVSVNHRDVRTMSAMQVGVFMRTASDVLVIAANPCADPLPEHETTA